jgi:microcystin-dependent protein
MEPFLGQIILVGFNFAPRGYMTCNGQLLSIAQYSALFSLLGTTYGGNGQTTFALPNLCGRVPIHQGQGPGLTYRTMGEVSGQENVTLISTQMPVHNHLVSANTTATSASPSGNFPAAAFVDATGDAVKGYAATGAVSLAPATVGFAAVASLTRTCSPISRLIIASPPKVYTRAETNLHFYVSPPQFLGFSEWKTLLSHVAFAGLFAGGSGASGSDVFGSGIKSGAGFCSLEPVYCSWISITMGTPTCFPRMETPRGRASHCV